MQKNEKAAVQQPIVVVTQDAISNKPVQSKDDQIIKDGADIKNPKGVLKEQMMAKYKVDNENKKLRKLRFKMEITSQRNTQEMREIAEEEEKKKQERISKFKTEPRVKKEDVVKIEDKKENIDDSERKKKRLE